MRPAVASDMPGTQALKKLKIASVRGPVDQLGKCMHVHSRSSRVLRTPVVSLRCYLFLLHVSLLCGSWRIFRVERVAVLTASTA